MYAIILDLFDSLQRDYLLWFKVLFNISFIHACEIKLLRSHTGAITA